MIKKRIAALAATIAVVAASVAVPAMASSFSYTKHGNPVTYNDTVSGTYQTQGVYAGWTSTRVKNSYPSYQGKYKKSYYYEFKKNTNNTYTLLWSDEVGGTNTQVTTYLGHDISSYTQKRIHGSELHSTIYSDSSIIETIETTVIP